MDKKKAWVVSTVLSTGSLAALCISLFNNVPQVNTGNMTKIAMFLMGHPNKEILDVVMMVVIYILGVVTFGLLFPKSKRVTNFRFYGGIFILGAAILYIAGIRQAQTKFIGIYVMGLINSTMSKCGDQTFATTLHVGNLVNIVLSFTDLLRGESDVFKSSSKSLALLGGYLVGAAIEAVFIVHTGISPWFVSATLFLISGVLFFMVFKEDNTVLGKEGA